MTAEGATTSSSAISLVKTIIGAGLLSMPLAFSTDGIVVGFWIILLAGATSGYGLFLQAYVSRYVPAGHATFFSLCSLTYPSLLVVFDLAIAVQCFGCAILYLVLIGDLMPGTLGGITTTATDSKTFWILLSAVVCVPLSFLRNLDSLKYTSVLGLLAIAYMALLVVGHYFIGDIPSTERGPVTLFPQSFASIFSTFSIIVFAFTGHQNMFSIINESRNKLLSALSTLIVAAVTGSAALFIFVGLTGYLTFGQNVTGNVILLYPSDLLSTVIGRLLIVFMVIFSFPLMLHPARISVNNIYFWINQRYSNSNERAPLLNNEDDHECTLPTPTVVPLSNVTFVVITTTLLVVGYVIAITVESFALVLAVVGATGSTAISFILPGLFGYKLIGSELSTPSATESTLKHLSLALSVWGVVVMIVCLYVSLS